MTITITPAIEKAYKEYLDDVVDYDFNGKRFQRRNTYPYAENEFAGMVPFAAGYQSLRVALSVAHEANNVQRETIAELEKKHIEVVSLLFGAIVQSFQDTLPDDAREIAGGILDNILTGKDEVYDPEIIVYPVLREYLEKFPKVVLPQ